ncbi:MAG: TrmH family RNA methyltransferase [Candidatus Delongbacteria bacterium]|nr:TrmH family RNA methyltransferase [Candidatus Delongbacteria bacterium]
MITVYHDDHDQRQEIIPYEVALDNIRSGFNVGSILRNGDAFGCRNFHLLGITANPTHPEVIKTSKGTDRHVQSRYWHDTSVFLEYLAEWPYSIYALETTDQSLPLGEVRFQFPCLVILGHEVTGVSSVLLARATQIISIPMMGIKNSINVSVASGILFYSLAMQYRTDSEHGQGSSDKE